MASFYELMMNIGFVVTLLIFPPLIFLAFKTAYYLASKYVAEYKWIAAIILFVVVFVPLLSLLAYFLFFSYVPFVIVLVLFIAVLVFVLKTTKLQDPLNF